MARHRQSPFLSQAHDLTLVRYGPELSALTALLRQAQQDRRTTIGSARSSAALIQAAVDQARPDVRANYRQASQSAAAQQAIAAPDLAGASAPIAGAAAIERSGLATQLASSRAQDLSSLDQRRVAAQEGAAYATQAANRSFTQTRGQIGQRAQDLAQEEGAYASSTLQQLMSQDAQTKAQIRQTNARLRQQERDALIGQGFDPSTGKPMAGGKLDPNSPVNRQKAAAKKWASGPAQAKAGDTIQQAFKEAKTLQQSGVTSRGEAEQMLLNGVGDIPAKPVYRTVTRNGKQVQVRVLNKDGTQKMTPAVPGIKAIDQNLYVQAGLDLAYQGHLSRRTQNLLHARGIKINPLGVTTYQQYMQRLAQALQRPGSAPNLIAGGAGGGSIPSGPVR